MSLAVPERVLESAGGDRHRQTSESDYESTVAASGPRSLGRIECFGRDLNFCSSQDSYHNWCCLAAFFWQPHPPERAKDPAILSTGTERIWKRRNSITANSAFANRGYKQSKIRRDLFQQLQNPRSCELWHQSFAVGISEFKDRIRSAFCFSLVFSRPEDVLVHTNPQGCNCFPISPK